MSLLQKSKDAECTPVMFSAAAKVARATGRAVKHAVEITGKAAVETAKDAALKTIKKGPKNAGVRSTSGGSRRQQLQRTRGDMSERNKAIQNRREQVQQQKKEEQNEVLQGQNNQEKQRRKQSAAAVQMLRV